MRRVRAGMIFTIMMAASSVVAADPGSLSVLHRPGVTVFMDGFESTKSFEHYFETGGLAEGRASIESAVGVPHGGTGCLRVTATANGGGSSGAGPCLWLGPGGHDRLHFRRWIRFAADYDQGDLHHTGGWLEATSGTSPWDHMGTAGTRPHGDDWFNAAFEPWCDWGRVAKPGWMFLYVYWMDMTRDPDGNWWGNNLRPEPSDRVVLKRDRWYCLEHMIKANTPGKRDGELAAWIDGKLYQHVTGMRWRTSAKVKLKRVVFGVYIHRSVKPNTVWYDDIVVSTGYVGP